MAPRLLGSLVRELHRAATGDLSDYDHLHQVRIIGKRLRYAMEIVADCYSPAFREELYPRIEEMQEILGRANDSHVATLRLEGLRTQVKNRRPRDWKRFRPGVEALLRQHRDRVPREREAFLQWWARWETEGGEVAFQSLLKESEAQRSA
jgi:CHAD domain-containing protein